MSDTSTIDHWADMVQQFRHIVAFVGQRGVPDHDAEDVAAAAMFKAWRWVAKREATFPNEKAFWAVVWNAARWEVTDYKRGRRNQAPLQLNHLPDDLIIDGVPEPDELPPQVVHAIAALPPEQRIALAALFDGVPPREMDGLGGRSTQEWWNANRLVRARLQRAYKAAGEAAL